MNPETKLLAALPGTVLDRVEQPARAARRTLVPAAFARCDLTGWFQAMVGSPDRLWHHQALALQHLAEGQNVVVATGTASGKSLIAMTPVIKGLRDDAETSYLILLPQKSLLADQLARWKAALELADLEPNLIAGIDGDVPVDDRLAAMRRARVLLSTDDTFHAWAMRSHANPAIGSFIRRLALVVIDEAHERKGVFGSNCAYLYRRIVVLRDRLRREAATGSRPLQWLGLSATIIEPAQHLERLTGQTFMLVDEADNGAPAFGLTILHVEGPAQGAAAQAILVETITKLADSISPDAAIAFVDGRQAVERITAQVDRDDVEPYRSGFEKEDRASIERALRNGQLRAVVATSALELGVDVPQFTIGINLGIPKSLMAMRQREGRTGRSAAAVFAIVAPANAFAALGTTFTEFLAGEVEPSTLYPENAIIQYGQARCIQSELGDTGGALVLPASVAWPSGFEEAFAQALPGALRPREIEQVAMLETGKPHLDFPMRRIAECRFTLRHAQSGADIGSIDLAKALREAYPGAVYLQRKHAYRVTEWRQTAYEQSIYLQPTSLGARSYPILSSRINASHAASELQEGHLLVSERGSLAEIRLQVTEAVLGYKFAGKDQLYRDLQKGDRRKATKQRNYSTTGVLLRIDEPWFKGHGGAAAEVRKQIAEALVKTLALEQGIAPSEIAFAFANIALHDPSGPRQIDDAVVIYDDVMGGMRLTTPLFTGFATLLDRLRRASKLAGEEALLDEITVTRLMRWYKALRQKDRSVDIVPALRGSQRLIYAAGSVVGIRVHGALQQRELLRPQLLDAGGGEQLFYHYAADSARTALVPHELIEPVGQNWRQVLWDPSTDTIEEIAA